MTLELDVRVSRNDVDVISTNANAYGIPDEKIINGIRLLASKEGLIADPVYEGRAIQGLLNLADEGRLPESGQILLMHLGGGPRHPRLCWPIRVGSVTTFQPVTGQAEPRSGG